MLIAVRFGAKHSAFCRKTRGETHKNSLQRDGQNPFKPLKTWGKVGKKHFKKWDFRG